MKVKKNINVGILTYHFSDNFGALIQAYSLRQWLNNWGLEANFINYHPTYVEEGGAFESPWKPTLWKKNFTILYMKLLFFRRRIFENKDLNKLFLNFRRDQLGIYSPPLRKAADLEPLMDKFDILLCGSDQIWNPSIQYGLDPVYFLDIPGSEQLHKLAYAPSFGRNSIPKKYISQLGPLVSKLDKVSVRETSGLDILEKAGISRNHVSVLPDPSILLGNFDKLLGEYTASEDSIFCYALRTDKIIRNVAIDVARISGSILRSPRSSFKRWPDIGEDVTPGPIEWLKMLKSSKIVVSNSFHGIALSIVLNRPFIAVSLPGKRKEMNARVDNLLQIMGLEDRQLTEANSTKIFKLIDSPIDWKIVNKRLALIRAEAEKYLDVEITKVRVSKN